MKVFNKKLVKDQYDLLHACSRYKVIHEKCDDVLDGHVKLSVILKSPPRRVSTNVCA